MLTDFRKSIADLGWGNNSNPWYLLAYISKLDYGTNKIPSL